MQIHLRPITQADNPGMARVIRSVMTEFGAVGAGYSIEDPEVDHMFESYDRKGHPFFVLESQACIGGGAGVGPLDQATADICELKKMYMLAQFRGQGMGRRLAEVCLDTARDLGYRRCYLETLESMKSARSLYRKLGFVDLEGPLGATGHFGCDRWMALDL